MRSLSLGEEFFEWTGNKEVLKTPYWKVTITSPAMVVSVNENLKPRGIVILGKVEAIVDTIVPTSEGAFGNTTIFDGTNLVILGLTIDDLKDSLFSRGHASESTHEWKQDAQAMIRKLQNRIRSKDFHFELDGDEDFEYVVFGKRNFLLVGDSKKFVLIHRKQIAIRSGEEKLVQIDPIEGILVANKNEVLNIGGYSTSLNLGGMLSDLGLRIASSVLDHVLWD
ncbi:MAG: hypothetical protein ACFFE8_13425 [Candidatus Heimdallarchaeota archaeon]